MHLALGTAPSLTLGIHIVTIIFAKDQSMISAESHVLENGAIPLARNRKVGKHLTVVGHKSDDRLVRLTRAYEKIDYSINDSFDSLEALE